MATLKDSENGDSSDDVDIQAPCAPEPTSNPVVENPSTQTQRWPLSPSSVISSSPSAPSSVDEIAVDHSERRNSSAEIELQPIDLQASTSKPLLNQCSIRPKGWPSAPSSIKLGWFSAATDTAVDVAMLVFASSFLGFALTVHFYDQAPTNDHPKATQALLNATKYGPTVFPIIFACVLGRASHSILLWRLETGERIGILDMLAGSTSLTSAVTSQLKLRMISLLGICLVAVWALSPVGGQACLRQMTLGQSASLQSAVFTYMIQKGKLDRFATTDGYTMYPALGAVFNAALLGPPKTKASPRDIWGNVKIPRLEEYEASSVADDEGWYTTNEDSTVYASLVGIPVAGLAEPDALDATDYAMNIEVRYFHLDCPVVGIERYTLYDGPERSYSNFTGPGATIYTWENTTARKEVDVNVLKPFNFSYFDWGTTGSSTCLLTTSYVEATVMCETATTCKTVNMRRSRLEHPPPAYTLLDSATGNFQNWEYFAKNFVRALDGHPTNATAVQGYLVDPDYPALAPAVLKYDDSYVKLPNELYALRLSQLMNTYWDCMLGMYAIPGSLNEKTASMTKDTTAADLWGLAYTTTAPGTKTIVKDVIQAHGSWTVALIFASTAMIIASLASPIIRCYLTRGPDLMLNISSLATRDSPYIALPVSGSYMDATERARLVKDMKVRFGDVGAESGVGRLAIGIYDRPGKQSIDLVRKKRLYV